MASDIPGQGAGPDQPGAGTTPPAAPGWGAPAPAGPPTQPAAPPQPGWGQQPAAPPQAPPTAPAPQAWAAPPAAGPAWGAGAAPQGPAPQQAWGPGGQQPGWQGGPPPAKGGGNGCLKACLIVGAILVVLAIVAIVALYAAGSSFVGGLGVDSGGNLKDCPIVSSAKLQTVLGPDTQASPLSGLANSTVGLTLDKRVLPDAENCWVGSGTSEDTTQTSGAFGRIAKYSGGDASSVFDKERSQAASGSYLAVDVPNAGDQAFCTGWSEYPATGALVRRGNDLVYVSFLLSSNLDFDQASADTGVVYSPKACADAVKIALLSLP